MALENDASGKALENEAFNQLRVTETAQLIESKSIEILEGMAA